MMQHSVLDNRKVGSSQPPGKDDAAQIEILKPITADEDKGSPHYEAPMHGEGGTLSGPMVRGSSQI